MSSPALPAAASAATPCPKPYREVICADSLQWLSAIPEGGLPPGSVGFTSIPDISELDAMFGGGASADYEGYAEWFTRAAALFMSRLPLASHCIFLQSDVRIMDGDNAAGWIDKAHLCSDAARRAGFRMLWHKMVSAVLRGNADVSSDKDLCNR